MTQRIEITREAYEEMTGLIPPAGVMGVAIYGGTTLCIEYVFIGRAQREIEELERMYAAGR